jgi:hypothetical protein
MSLLQTMGEKLLRAAHGRGLAVLWLIVALVEVITTLLIGINTQGDVVYALRSFVLLLLLAIGLRIVDSQFVYLRWATWPPKRPTRTRMSHFQARPIG